jgi:hypothetical protein
VVPIAVAGIQSAPVPSSELQARGLTGALLREAARRPRAIAAHVGREFLHFWELYPQRLTTDNASRRAEIHAGDPRLPAEPTFPPALRDRVSTLASVAEVGLSLVGLGILWRRRRAEAVLLLAVMLAFGLGYSVLTGRMRYRIPVVPALLVLAGGGATRILSPSKRAGADVRRARSDRAPTASHTNQNVRRL